ncbi:MAG: hypothetical protein GMKNLPBB_01288 [Myxococcota bacterium]|nr:hypothetical protein [Myxococcota bacterium]
MKARRFCWGLLLAVSLFPAGTRAQAGSNTTGMCVHVPPGALLDACAELGVEWVRMDGNWFDLEPKAGQYNWGFLDAPIKYAASKRLKTYLTLAYTPEWEKRKSDTDGRFHNDPPVSSTGWVSFVTAAVKHYRALGVTHFGLWNEPNLKQFWEGGVDDYLDLIVKPGAAAVRAACKDCKVLGPDLANVGEVDKYLEEVLRRSVRDFDIITHHIYNGFPETGTSTFDGDSYINVLDKQRFNFTRKSLRQLLDAAGYSGEVWITEAGYRTKSIGDAKQEETQAIFYRRALEEQLARSWVTNTFFYEILDCGPDQPNCEIDGFGILRAIEPDPAKRKFPASYRRKPAFDELKKFIAAHPELRGGVITPPSDAGAGGEGGAGDSGSGPPDSGTPDAGPSGPVVRAPRLPASPPGDENFLAAWSAADFHRLGGAQYVRLSAPHNGDADLSSRFALGWTDSDLWLGVEVTDDGKGAPQPADLLWQTDSVQWAFDTDHDRTRGAYDDDGDFEFGAGRQGSIFRFKAPNGFRPMTAVSNVREAGKSFVYAIRVPFADIGVKPRPGLRMGFTLLVNDDDGAGRKGFIEWTPGVGSAKDPSLFGVLELVDAPGPTDAGTPEAAVDTGPSDSGTPDSALADISSSDAGAADDSAGPSADGNGASGDGMADGASADGFADDSPVPGEEAGENNPQASPDRDGGKGVNSGGLTRAGEGGCACSASPSSSSGLSWGWAALGLLLWRRRRFAIT